MPTPDRAPSPSPNRPQAPYPELSEVERLKLENLTLKRYALELQLQHLLRERENLIRQIEGTRPGWLWRENPQGFVPTSPAE